MVNNCTAGWTWRHMHCTARHRTAWNRRCVCCSIRGHRSRHEKQAICIRRTSKRACRSHAGRWRRDITDQPASSRRCNNQGKVSQM
ncbi:hypothetical protein BC831DRAFT_465497 [Entophlyctis helioformis]|nr:hypothetical protein BC831DRAFT_465497 [Entophlyctis helioformis]